MRSGSKRGSACTMRPTARGRRAAAARARRRRRDRLCARRQGALRGGGGGEAVGQRCRSLRGAVRPAPERGLRRRAGPRLPLDARASLQLFHQLVAQHVPRGRPARGGLVCRHVPACAADGQPMRRARSLGRRRRPADRDARQDRVHQDQPRGGRRRHRRGRLRHVAVSADPLLENHCSLPQQRIVAKLFVDGFGEPLMMPPPAERLANAPLPSPKSLQHRILLKGKVSSEQRRSDQRKLSPRLVRQAAATLRRRRRRRTPPQPPPQPPPLTGPRPPPTPTPTPACRSARRRRRRRRRGGLSSG